jgi:integrase/recombinase XerD
VTALREALADYLQIRRRLGFTMPQDGRLLEGFVEFCERAGAERISTELALAWARIPVHAHPHTWRQRLSVVRGFARHLATIDAAGEVPSTDLLPGHRPRVAPYVYSQDEITAMLRLRRSASASTGTTSGEPCRPSTYSCARSRRRAATAVSR